MDHTAHRPRRLRRRLPLLVLAVALAGSALPGTAHATEHLIEVPIEGYCAAAPPPPFDDVAADGTFVPYVACLAHAGLTLGTAGGERFEPGRAVTRGQMASFVARLMDQALERAVDDTIVALPAAEGRSAFVDVPASDVHAESIGRLAAAGVALGGPSTAGPEVFGPEQPVTRAQMASFVVRALGALIDEELVAEESGSFADVADDVHAAAIDFLGELGIVIGDVAGRFRPGDPVRRDQLAAVLVRSLSVLYLSDLIDPPAA